MKRPERNQNSEAKQQQRENEILRVRGKRMRFRVFDQFRNVERVRAALQIKRNQSNQRNQRADAQVNCDLKCRVILAFAASPDANHDERRNEGEFMQEIKE